jgi:Toprim-like
MKLVDMGGTYTERRERDMSGVLSMAALEQHDPESPRRQPERRFLCPMPACSGHQNPRRHRKLFVNVTNGLWKCHLCDEGGKLAEFWTDTPAGVTYTPSKRPAKPVHVLQTDKTIDECPLDDIRLEWLRKQPRLSADTAATGREYLKLRGLDIEQCIDAKVIYTPDFRGRRGVIFPMYGDARRSVLGGAQVRFIDNHPDMHRMETFKGSNMSQTMFMTAGAIPENRDHPWFLCVTEAPIDALSLSSAGIPAVATIGRKSALPDWIMRVLKFPAFVILATDNDKAGQEMAADFYQQIHTRMFAEHSFILPTGCPDSYWKSQSVVIRHPRTGKDWNEVLVKFGADAVRHELESDPEQNLTLDDWMEHYCT